MASLDTGNGLRNREMKELYLDTGKHPTAKFKSVSVVGPNAVAPNQPADIKVTGDFTLQAVTHGPELRLVGHSQFQSGELALEGRLEVTAMSAAVSTMAACAPAAKVERTGE